MPFLAYKVGATKQFSGENMRKFWRIGLILVIGLSACGDKKAEQAKALQQEMQDMLAKAASSKMFTYGDVAVTPDGDAFAVTVDKVSVTLPEVSPIDLGKIGFKLTPDGDDIRKFSDLTWPQSVTVKDTDGKEVKITTAIDHANGTWSKKLGELLSADILLKSLEASEPTSGSAVCLRRPVSGAIQGQRPGHLRSERHPGRQAADHLRQGRAILRRRLQLASAVGVPSLPSWWLPARNGRSGRERKPGEMLPFVAKIFSLIKSMNFEFSTGQISVATGGAPIFTLGGFGFGFAMKDTDQPKVQVTSSFNYAGLSIPQLKAMVGGLGAEVLPTEFGLTLKVDDLPMAAILDAWSKTLPDTKMTDENAMMGTGMMAAGAAIQAIQQATVKMTVSDGKLKAPGLTGSFTADVNNDPKAPMGFTGVANVELSDLDALIAKGQQYAAEADNGGDRRHAADDAGACRSCKGCIGQYRRSLQDHHGCPGQCPGQWQVPDAAVRTAARRAALDRRHRHQLRHDDESLGAHG
jgi:hypothetical protein